ncbi:hypothetical protein CISIN_1g039109mg [Citrus sinensis]|uniref:Retrotransposon gag domain-containing protein n=1 Tax=Citrus sinensis TaxID=2711 RepID=A0A067ELP5_CITSI|nr:hypothetical protein CISIN_1g039109mg [Citrus sinensis]
MVSEYQTRFERLLARAGHLTDKQEAECFISGLKDGLRTDVQKYTFGHKCKKLFLIEAEEGDEPKEHEKEKDVTQETPAISLHALARVQSPQTMRLQSSISKASLTILIDSGSTHNFLHHKFAKITGLKSEPGCLLSVVVANGEKLTSPGRCKGVQLQLQGTQIEAYFYLLSLEGCDAVLGAQWLCTLGSILWDFDKMEMQFTKDGHQVTLRGATTSELKAIEGDTIQKTLRKN